jgi:hypothetical protein
VHPKHTPRIKLQALLISWRKPRRASPLGRLCQIVTTEAWTRVAAEQGLFGMTRSLGQGYDVLFRYYASCMKEV